MESKKSSKKQSDKNSDALLNLNPLDFEEALDNLLQVKPMSNEKAKVENQKKKRKPKK